MFFFIKIFGSAFTPYATSSIIYGILDYSRPSIVGFFITL